MKDKAKNIQKKEKKQNKSVSCFPCCGPNSKE